MRTLSENLLAQIGTKLGTEPLAMLKVAWSTGTKYYADKDLGTGDGSSMLNAKGLILNLSNYSVNAKIGQQASVSSLTVDLDDIDGSIKTFINTHNPYVTAVDVYQYYEVINESVLIFTGQIIGPFTWSEGERKVSLTLESKIEDKEVGFALSENDMTLLPDELIGKAWPLCFGTVLRSPAIKVTNVLRGSTQEAITQESTSVRITGGENFPQGTSVTVSIEGHEITGTFSDDEFTFSSALGPKFHDIACANRPATDTDKDDYCYAWISSAAYAAGVRLEGLWVTDGEFCNYCVKQHGTKCKFQFMWDTLKTSADTFDEANEFGMSDWGSMFVSSGYGLTIFPTEWSLDSGADVYLLSDTRAVYIANCITSSVILEVMAYRSIAGKEVLVAIPSSYYTVDLDYNAKTDLSIVSDAPTAATAIIFDRSLIELKKEGWRDDEIYVSLRSSQSNDPATTGSNIADVITYLLTTYSNLTPDTDTFAAVKTACANYPVNLSILDKQNVLALCERIAWEGRCALNYQNGFAYIKYLSVEPESVFTIEESAILNKSLDLTSQDASDIFTKIKSSWKRELSEKDKETKGKVVVAQNNVTAYGLIEQEETFTIYNIKSLVAKSTDFWLKRGSNYWKTVHITTFQTALPLEIFDCITLNTSYVATTTTKAIVLGIEYNDDRTIKLTLWLPIIIGAMAKSSSAWLDDSADTMPPDAGAGRAQRDYIPDVKEEKTAENSNNNVTNTNETGGSSSSGSLVLKAFCLTDAPADTKITARLAVNANAPEWAADHGEYAVNTIVRSPDNGNIYKCKVKHNSADHVLTETYYWEVVNDIEVTCTIMHGDKLNAATPLLESGKAIFVTLAEGWECVTIFQGTQECD